VEVNADQELIKILFRNLVNNACKYNEQDSIEIKIEAKPDPQVAIYFRDNGIGIKKSNWSVVFEEFSRIVESKDKSISGTGLGLAICKKIMQLHNGDVEIVNSSENGTTFRLKFASA
jgi:signal transduction histidine kinase